MSSKVAPISVVDAAAPEISEDDAVSPTVASGGAESAHEGASGGTSAQRASHAETDKPSGSASFDSGNFDQHTVEQVVPPGTHVNEELAINQSPVQEPVGKADAAPGDAIDNVTEGATIQHEGDSEAGEDNGNDDDDDGDDDDESSSDEDDSGSEFEVPVRTHGDWDAFVDEDSGTEYYYNRKTGETTWDVPDPALMPPHVAALEFLNKLMTNPYDLDQPHPLSSHGEWSLYVDSDSMAMYYCNDDTGETSWESPDEWNEKLASIPPLAVLTGEDETETGGLADLVAARAGDKPSRPHDATASTAREPRGPDSERTAGGEAEAESPLQDQQAISATKSEKLPPPNTAVGTDKGLDAIDQEKVWFVYRDIENLMQYFVNAKSGESTWEPPLDIASQVIEHEAASIQPGEWQLYINKEEDDGEPDDCVAIVKGWEVYQDRASGRWYYFNPVTGETQWDAPNDVLQAAPEDWEAGGASTDADGNVVNHGKDEEPVDSDGHDSDLEHEETQSEHEELAQDSAVLTPSQELADADADADAEEAVSGAGASSSDRHAAEAAPKDAGGSVDDTTGHPSTIVGPDATAGVSDSSGVAAGAVAQALVAHQASLRSASQQEHDDATGVREDSSDPAKSSSAAAGPAAAHSPERPAVPVHTTPKKSRAASRPQSKPPTRPPTAGRKKSKKDKSEKKKDKSKKKKDKSKKKKDKSKKKKKSKQVEEESDSDDDLGDLLGANAAYQHEKPLAAGAAVQQTLDDSQRHRAPSSAGGATSVMDAIAMIQRAYGNNVESDDEDDKEGTKEEAETAKAAPPSEPVEKADENATYKIFMPPPPKPSGNSGLGFGLAIGVKSRFGKKPLAPGMDVEDPEEEEQKRRQAEQEAVRARILAAQEAKRLQEEEDAKLAELEGNDAASANALNLLASAAGLSATELAKMLERRKVDDPNNKGLLAWAKAFLTKTQKKAKTLESRLRLDSKIDDETKQKLQEEIKRLKLLCDKLREWEEEERKRRREMDEEMKQQLKDQAEAEKERLTNKRARIRAEREAAKQRAADERKRKAEEAKAAMRIRKEREAELKEQREAAAAAELQRKRALAASVKS